MNFKARFESFAIEEELYPVFISSEHSDLTAFGSLIYRYDDQDGDNKPKIDGLDSITELANQIVSRLIAEKQETLRQLDEEAYVSERERIDIYFDDFLLESYDKAEVLRKEMKRVQRTREKTDDLKKRQELAEEYERLRRELFTLEKQNFDLREKQDRVRKRELATLETKRKMRVVLELVNAAYCEIV